MDWSVIWKSFVLIFSGIAILRISGRKSISQMTLAQTVVMVSIGTVIVAPLVGKSMISTILIGVIFVFSTILLEFLELKFNVLEKLITGKSKMVIENGILNIENLRKLRMTVDQLEMRMRNEGISKMEDIKMATIEANGLLGYELKDDAKPVTVGELKKILNQYLPTPQNMTQQPVNTETNPPNIFEELKNPDASKHPDYLH
ncbi:DUF421 domain-containing protein [Bacillus sp. JJ1764]|uniref:DUF421 domain-containing protein n=1 Tax=Bacillus sp. JJ1764 TaxID=3122964 RepID=UPI003000F625